MKDYESISRKLSVLRFALLAALTTHPLCNVVRADDLVSVNKAAEASFTKHVLPILKQHCYACHSHQAGKAKGGLVLDSRSGWAKGGESGPVVVPGKPDVSLLISAVRYAMGGFFHGTSTIYKTERGVWSDVNVNDLPEISACVFSRSARSAC